MILLGSCLTLSYASGLNWMTDPTEAGSIEIFSPTLMRGEPEGLVYLSLPVVVQATILIVLIAIGILKVILLHRSKDSYPFSPII